MRRLVLLAAAVPVASLLVAGASAAASTTAVTFTGSVQLPAGSGTLIVQAEQGHNVIDPRVLTDVQVASEAISSGAFSISVPQSAAVTKAEVNGWVPFVLTVESGHDVTVQNISVPLSKKAANGNAGVTRQLADHVVALPPFGAFYTSTTLPLTSASLVVKCGWQRYGREKERVVRIGQMHLTKQGLVKVAGGV